MYKFSKTSCRLLDTFIRGRSQYIHLNDRISSPIRLYRGVPQGSALGPQIFLLYINDLLSQLSNLKGYLYADDVQLVAISDSVNELENMINSNLGQIEVWCRDNFVVLNAQKSKAMLFGDICQNLPTIKVNNEELFFVSYVKVLGIYIDRKLTFDNHINFLVSRVIFTLRRLYSTSYYLPIKVRKKVAHALLMPLILYGIEIYTLTNDHNINRIRKCFYCIIRYIYQLRYHDHVTSYVIDFLHCNFHDYINVKLLALFYKIIKFNSPPYLANRFIFLNSSRTCSLRIPNFDTLIMKRSFHLKVARLWNNIIPYNGRHFSKTNQQFTSFLMDNL